MIKSFYKYNLKTKEYIEKIKVDVSKFGTPIFATKKTLPKLQTNQTVLFINNNWQIVADYRNFYQYDEINKQFVKITRFGDVDYYLSPTDEQLVNSHLYKLNSNNKIVDRFTKKELAEQQLQKTIKEYEKKIQEHLDKTAQAKGYDNILSACSYAGHSAAGTFYHEGRAFLAWRSGVWKYLYPELKKIQQDKGKLPSVEDVIAKLPTIQKYFTAENIKWSE